MANAGRPFALAVTEDVTGTVQFEPNNPEMAETSITGLVTTLDLTGDVAVMARYQGQVGVFRATIPLGVPVDSTPEPKNFIDELVFAKLKTLLRKAEPRTVEATWRRAPHPDLAAAKARGGARRQAGAVRRGRGHAGRGRRRAAARGQDQPERHADGHVADRPDDGEAERPVEVLVVEDQAAGRPPGDLEIAQDVDEVVEPPVLTFGSSPLQAASPPTVTTVTASSALTRPNVVIAPG